MLCLCGALTIAEPELVAGAKGKVGMTVTATATAKDDQTAASLATKKAIQAFKKKYPNFKGELASSLTGCSNKNGTMTVTVRLSAP